MTLRNKADQDTWDRTWFQRAIHHRVYCPDEALAITESHHRHAAESRARGPDWEIKARLHDERASFCEAHAATLSANAAAPAP